MNVSSIAKRVSIAAVAIAITVATMVPADARYYRQPHHRGNAAVGAALAVGALGVGAAIASRHRRDRYDDGYGRRGYYGNGYGGRGDYGDGYYRR